MGEGGSVDDSPSPFPEQTPMGKATMERIMKTTVKITCTMAKPTTMRVKERARPAVLPCTTWPLSGVPLPAADREQAQGVSVENDGGQGTAGRW